MSLFKDDPLLSVPGTTYLYTTHGWTLLSAVIEKAADQDFLSFMKKLFKDLGMENTRAEFNNVIIYNRARLLFHFIKKSRGISSLNGSFLSACFSFHYSIICFHKLTYKIDIKFGILGDIFIKMTNTDGNILLLINKIVTKKSRQPFHITCRFEFVL